jgi:protein gp37
MNKQGPSKIDYSTHTWNPISGCLHACDYCYMRRMEKRFPGIMKPTFHEKRLNEPLKLKKPSVIFVGSSGDGWGDYVPNEWIERVLRVIEDCPQHTFLFLTKNPQRYGSFSFSKNCIVGTTVDGSDRTRNNLEDLKEFTNGHCHLRRWVSFEPLLGPVHPDLSLINWIVIGSDSTRGARRPETIWGLDLIREAYHAGIPVWIKDNWPELPRIKDRPF